MGLRAGIVQWIKKNFVSETGGWKFFVIACVWSVLILATVSVTNLIASFTPDTPLQEYNHYIKGWPFNSTY